MSKKVHEKNGSKKLMATDFLVFFPPAWKNKAFWSGYWKKEVLRMNATMVSSPIENSSLVANIHNICIHIRESGDEGKEKFNPFVP